MDVADCDLVKDRRCTNVNLTVKTVTLQSHSEDGHIASISVRH